LALAHVPAPRVVVSSRVLRITALAVALAFLAGLASRVLVAAIAFVTNLAFLGRFSLEPASPSDAHLGLFVVLVPVAGGLVVGLMARYGSKAIRGHGIPEAMEHVLRSESRIPARMTLLKPLSAAVAIGTGGPFGAEGPIIATGGALGSQLGQLVRTSAAERKTLLAAGAAAGMAATFGSPVSAVLLAVELLLFEWKARSLVPVALASFTAAGVRLAFVGSAPAFVLPALAPPSGSALVFYVVLGAVVGVAAAGVTRAVYAVEDAFERLPLHWMWWPALGGVVVGAVGYFEPRTMGVGYDNIDHVLSGSLTGRALLFLCGLKLVSWLVALGSGTSGGTLAPLFTIGGGLGAGLGAVASAWLPRAGIDPRIAALVGMAALFAGASRALLASVVFAFETTLQPLGLLPLLGGCAAAYLVSCFLLENTIMTEKIARRGVRVPSEYAADFLELLRVADFASPRVVSFRSADTLARLRSFFAGREPGSQHHGFPVVDDEGQLLGVVTRREVLDPSRADDEEVGRLLGRPVTVVFADSSLREAADLMVSQGVGRLPVVSRADPRRLTGIVTRSDLLSAHARRLAENEPVARRARRSA
jgi:H+/Cl- antiporter ClcA